MLFVINIVRKHEIGQENKKSVLMFGYVFYEINYLSEKKELKSTRL